LYYLFGNDKIEPSLKWWFSVVLIIGYDIAAFVENVVLMMC